MISLQSSSSRIPSPYLILYRHWQCTDESGEMIMKILKFQDIFRGMGNRYTQVQFCRFRWNEAKESLLLWLILKEVRLSQKPEAACQWLQQAKENKVFSEKGNVGQHTQQRWQACPCGWKWWRMKLGW